MKIAVPKETAAGERRVALVPDVVRRLTGSDHEMVVEAGAGEAAMIPDALFEEAGATIASDPAAAWDADVVAKVAPPSEEEVGRLKGDSVLIGFLSPLTNASGVWRPAVPPPSRWRLCRASRARSRWTRCPRRATWRATAPR